MERRRFGDREDWAFWPGELRLEDMPLVPPEELPDDLFSCGRCGQTLWLAAQTEVVHDCATGEVSPA